MNALSIYPQAIQNVFEAVSAYTGSDIWSDLLDSMVDARDKELTSTLCSSDCADFVVMDGSDAFLFVYNEQTNVWEVSHAGQPVYEVEPEMIGDAEIDFNEFLSDLQHELPGVEVKPGSALNNQKSVFVQQFKDRLDKAFDLTLSNYF